MQTTSGPVDPQYYYKLMASYLSKRQCDESFVRYFLGGSGKGPRRAPDEQERADERKRRLQRERSRRYRALKNARRHRPGRERERERSGEPPPLDSDGDDDSPPTLCDWSDDSAEPSAPPPPPAAAPAARPAEPGPPLALAPQDLLSSSADLDFPALHSLMLQWLQT